MIPIACKITNFSLYLYIYTLVLLHYMIKPVFNWLFYNFQSTGLKFSKLNLKVHKIWHKLAQTLTFFVFEIPKAKIIWKLHFIIIFILSFSTLKQTFLVVDVVLVHEIQ